MSLVMHSQKAFPDENGRLLPCSNVRSCNCCPYGYHIDLDFVRYCEALENSKPSEEELQRRSRRRSRKSMEFMLGLDNIFDEWDASTRVQAVPEADSEPDSPRLITMTTSTPCLPHRQRSSSVPRFAYATNIGRSDSPFGTASSTCSSGRVIENDVATSVYANKHFNNKFFLTNGKPETKAFLREALDDVCNDFERTLERTSMRRKKHLPLDKKQFAMDLGSAADRNNNQMTNGHDGANEKRCCNTWDSYFDVTDTCIGGNKSPRSSRAYTRSNTLPIQKKLSPAEIQYESYVQATVAANSKSPVEVEASKSISMALSETEDAIKPSALKGSNSPPPPPPPPRRRSQTSKTCSPTSSEKETDSNLTSPMGVQTTDNAVPDAQTLYNIRQQMALSLKRMKDLEEQVKTIPEMQLELSQLRNEKQRLEQKLFNKEEELLRARDIQRLSSSPSPISSPKYASPVQFTPQRISPISLESVGNRMRTSSTSSERQSKQVVMKRDVGVMCSRAQTREVAVGSPLTVIRSTGTSPLKEFKLSNINDPLYSKEEMDSQIRLALRKFEAKYELDNKKTVASVGTQMNVAKVDQKSSGVQTQTERPVEKINVGINAKPETREMFTSCVAEIRSIGTSNDNIADTLCVNCSKGKKSIACGSNDPLTPGQTKGVSLRQLDMLTRSNTFSLGEKEKLPQKVTKSISTQCSPTPIHNTGSQTIIKTLRSAGVQSVPGTTSIGIQNSTLSLHKTTDTKDLIRLMPTKVLTEEISSPTDFDKLKPQMKNCASNTDKVKTVNSGVNPTPPPVRKHMGSNTEKPNRRDIGCGDVVKPHISIACADNYCDSCKEVIKHLAKDFSKTQAPPASPLPVRNVDSKIPRPKNLPSPSPARKTFQRQNTYTIDTPPKAPSPTSTSTSMPTATPTTPVPTTPPLALSAALAVKMNKVGKEKEKGNKTPSSPQSSLHEKPPTIGSFHTELQTGPSESQQFVKQPLKKVKDAGGSLSGSEDETTLLKPTKSMEAYDLTRIGKGDLLVREEKKVSVSWSRDASPIAMSSSYTVSTTMAKDTDSPNKTLQNTLNEKLEAEAALADKHQTPPPVSLAQLKSSQKTSDAQNKKEDKEGKKSATASQDPPGASLTNKTNTGADEKSREIFKPPKDVMSSLKIINESLLKKMGAKPFSSSSLKSAKQIIQNEWFRISSTEKSNPYQVEDYLQCFEELSVPLLEYCVNMADVNGNTAMHYAVSHGNFEVVSKLLDSKVCNVNQTNNAGYTSVMLVSLAKLKDQEHRVVVQRLFQMADVNIRAKKHCQTALMLAVSHGNMEMVELLLSAGADVNVQDEDGSTALMCAAEHGRVDIVKHLLSQSECNSLIQDVDGSTAFKIAWQAGHRDIGMLLYIHEQMLKSKMPNGGDTSPNRMTSSLTTPAHLQHLQQQVQLHKEQKKALQKSLPTGSSLTASSSSQPPVKRQTSK